MYAALREYGVQLIGRLTVAPSSERLLVPGEEAAHAAGVVELAGT